MNRARKSPSPRLADLSINGSCNDVLNGCNNVSNAGRTPVVR